MTALVNTSTMADLVGLRPCTIRKWANKGMIPCIRVGPKVMRFDPEKVRAAMEKLS